MSVMARALMLLRDSGREKATKGENCTYCNRPVSGFHRLVLENCPDAVHVFDHFHVVKLMNEHLDDIRRKV